MKKIIIALLLLSFNCIAQEVSLGIEIEPTFATNPSRMVKPNINIAFEVDFGNTTTYLAANSTELVGGTYFGTKAFKFGVFAKVDVSQQIQLTPVMGVRFEHRINHGFVLMAGGRFEIPLLSDRVYTYSPVWVGVKKIINNG